MIPRESRGWRWKLGQPILLPWAGLVSRVVNQPLNMFCGVNVEMTRHRGRMRLICANGDGPGDPELGGAIQSLDVGKPRVCPCSYLAVGMDLPSQV